MSGETQSRHCWWLMLMVSLAHNAAGSGYRPQPHRLVGAAGDDAAPVGANATLDTAGVAGQRWRRSAVRYRRPTSAVLSSLAAGQLIPVATAESSAIDPTCDRTPASRNCPQGHHFRVQSRVA